MPDLLLELRSEEIPARMQRKAAGDLRKLVTDALVDAGLTYEAGREYWTPRRLALDIRGVTAKSADIREERKGPRTDAPAKAIEGFLRGAGLSSIDEAELRSDPKKGDFYVAVIRKPGRRAEDIIAEAMPPIIRGFPWPKSMRWGSASGKKGVDYGGVEGRGSESLRWVRPLQSVVCTFGPETEEPVVVPFEIDGIRSGNVTYGHRFHAPGPITVRRFEDYAKKLADAFVVIDPERRRHTVEHDAGNLAFASGLELVRDDALLEEVANLVEWPVTLMGEFDEDYLSIPPEVIRLTIRANQKCFVCHPIGGQDAGRESISPLEGEMSGRAEGGTSPRTQASAFVAGAAIPPSVTSGDISPSRGEIGGLSNRFILVANIEAKDGGREIVHGNGKVVRARLSDALYFWRTDQADLPDLGTLAASAAKFGLDLKKPLDQRMAKLDHLGVTFHAKLGTQGERVERIRRLAGEIADVLEAQGYNPSSGPSGHLPQGEKGSRGASHTPITSSRGEIGPSLRQLAERAAVLAKADLVTEVVGEFPELQGLMGRKYGELQGEHPSVAAAIEEHYKPVGPSDTVPRDPVSIAVALADKLDTLVGFWAIDERPTGSKDPYALRRAALGVIRLVLENEVRLNLLNLPVYKIIPPEFVPPPSGGDYYDAEHFNRYEFDDAIEALEGENVEALDVPTLEKIARFARRQFDLDEFELKSKAKSEHYRVDVVGSVFDFANPHYDLLAFFHDRLKVYLRDNGARYDLIDAVLAAGSDPSSGPSGHLLPQGEKERRGGRDRSISPLEGEMPGRAEGGDAASRQTAAAETVEASAPPSVASGDISPSRGEIGGAANDDLLAIVRRVEALSELLGTETGANLLTGAKRAANILAAEEKKGTRIADAVDPSLFGEKTESLLYEAVNAVEKSAAEAIRNEDYSAAMTALAALREPVDAFFENVLVNAEDDDVRANRLALLARIRAATLTVADFSKIAG